MSEPTIAEVKQKLEGVLAKLKQTNDPEMRILIAELDRLVLASTRSYKTRSD
jgi:hypothetical protein